MRRLTTSAQDTMGKRKVPLPPRKGAKPKGAISPTELNGLRDSENSIHFTTTRLPPRSRTSPKIIYTPDPKEMARHKAIDDREKEKEKEKKAMKQRQGKEKADTTVKGKKRPRSASSDEVSSNTDKPSVVILPPPNQSDSHWASEMRESSTGALEGLWLRVGDEKFREILDLPDAPSEADTTTPLHAMQTIWYKDMDSKEDVHAQVAHLLRQVQGQEDFKEYIWQIVEREQNCRERQEAGIAAPADKAKRLVISGPAGVGKTTLAKLLAKVLHLVGRVQDPELEEINGADFIAQYEGQSEAKVQLYFKKADERGQVLFIDEFYSADSSGGSNGFGTAIINTFLTELNSHPTVPVILAGYEKETDDYMGKNNGVKRRFKRLRLSPYDDADLASIAYLKMKDEGYQYAKGNQEAFLKHVKDFITSIPAGYKAINNGQVSEDLITNAIDVQMMREGKTKAFSKVLTRGDLQGGTSRLLRTL